MIRRFEEFDWFEGLCDGDTMATGSKNSPLPPLYEGK